MNLTWNPLNYLGGAKMGAMDRLFRKESYMAECHAIHCGRGNKEAKRGRGHLQTKEGNGTIERRKEGKATVNNFQGNASPQLCSFRWIEGGAELNGQWSSSAKTLYGVEPRAPYIT